MRVVGVGWLMRDADLVCDTCDCVCKESAQLRISQDQDATKKRDMQQKYLSLLILNQSSQLVFHPTPFTKRVDPASGAAEIRGGGDDAKSRPS